MLYFFILLPLLLWSDDFTAEIKPSTTQIIVTDPLYLELKLQYPENYKTDPQKLVANLLDRGSLAPSPFTFLKVETISEETTNRKTTETIRFILEPQVIGNHSLSFFGIPFIPKDPSKDPPKELISPVFSISIIPAPSNPNYRGVTAPPLNFSTAYPITPNLSNRRHFMDEPLSILAQRNLDLWQEKQIPWMTITVVILLALLIYLIRKMPRHETEEQRIHRLQKKAMQELDQLRAKRLPQAEKFEPYYMQLTNTVRQYIEERYKLSAPTQTTREFLENLAKHPIFDEQTQKNLRDFLLRADLVKFAQYAPSNDECAYAEIAARKVIDK